LSVIGPPGSVTRQSAAENPAGTKSGGTGSGFGGVVAQAERIVQTAAGRNRFMVNPFVWVRPWSNCNPHPKTMEGVRDVKTRDFPIR
jgi:hypothetical protein